MAFQPLKFKPGINREMSDYANEGGWYDCDKIRFRSGLPENIGGWVRYSEEQLNGTIRAMFNWTALDSLSYLAIGTTTYFYIEQDTTFYDMTPALFLDTLGADPIATTNGSATLTITIADHRAVEGTRVIISGAATTNGVPDTEINAEHTVVSVTSSSVFTIAVTTTATSTGSGGGASVSLTVLVSPGSGTSAGGLGWNAGPYSRNGWGEPYTNSALSSTRVWSIDAYGEDLFFCIRDGEVFYWDKSVDGLTTRPRELQFYAADVPVVAKAVLVAADERRAFAFGCNPTGDTAQDPLLIRWSASEDILTWTPDLTNDAGEIRLTSGNAITAVVKTKQEYLVWTDSSVFSLQRVGVPEFYGIQPLANNVSIMGPSVAITANNITFWMGKDKFYVYSGAVDTLPCSVLRYVFNDINPVQSFQFFAGTNEGHNEVIWFYCSATSSSIDRYVIFNHLEKIWYYGTLARSAWLDAPMKDYPLASGYDNRLYYHEFGIDDGTTQPAQAIASHIESSPVDLGEGERFMFVRSVIPDVNFTGSSASNPAVTMTVTPRNNPGTALGTADSLTVTRSAVSPVDQFTQRVWIRLRGRQITYKIANNALGVKWQLGAPRIEVQQDGRRA